VTNNYSVSIHTRAVNPLHGRWVDNGYPNEEILVDDLNFKNEIIIPINGLQG